MTNLLPIQEPRRPSLFLNLWERFTNLFRGETKWVCDTCGWVQYREEEVRCWNCGLGTMHYRGPRFYYPDKEARNE